MKALTMTHMSLSSLRHRRTSYRLLLTGIIISIYFVCVLALAVQGTMAASDKRYRDQVGYQDAAILGSDIPPHVLTDNGLASRVGVIHVLARTDTDLLVGALDATAQTLLNRRCVAGRLPEQPGEIAVEQSALARMRLDIGVGDSITLTLQDASGVKSVETTFTLTGILTEQTQAQAQPETYIFYQPYAGFPELLVSPGQILIPPSVVGQTLLVSYAPGINHTSFNEGLTRHGYDEWFIPYGNDLLRDEAAQAQMTLFLEMGLALVLTGCVGIANAFQTQMAERRDQIAMMRAVGATKRQIRRIFVREALLIALIAAPAALFLSWLTVWLLLRAIPDALVIPKQPLAYAIALIASMLVVLASALIPAFAGARVSPMQSLRRISVQRRVHSKKLRSQRSFRVPQLVARRAAQLYPARQIGLMLLIALVMWLATGAASSFRGIRETMADQSTRPDYELQATGYSVSSGYTFLKRNRGLAQADIRQIEQLPHVKRVAWTQSTRVNLLLDAPTLYGQAFAQRQVAPGNVNLPAGERLPVTDDELARSLPAFAAQKRVENPVLLADGDVFAVNAELIENLAPFLSEGAIDLDKINSGQQVLLTVPDLYVYATDDPDMLGADPYKPMDGINVVRTLTNDQFRAGEAYPILQAYVFEEEGLLSDDVEKHHVLQTPSIGGLLTGNMFEIGRVLESPFIGQGLNVITTHEGLNALGFYTGGIFTGNTWLDGQPTGEERKALTQEMERIAMRDPDVTLIDQESRTRTWRQYTLRALVTLMGVILLLTALSISMMNTSLSSRVRADARTIGMLRAVGADRNVLKETYRRQLLHMAVPGVLLGTAVCIYFIWENWVIYGNIVPMVAIFLASLVVITLGATSLHLNRLLRRATSEGIVAAMREL